MIQVHIRWMIQRDMAEVLSIEDASPHPWDADEIRAALRQRNCVAMVAEVGDRIVGWMNYAIYKRRIHLLNLAVHPHYQLCGIGRMMLAKLQNKLEPDRRTSIVADVHERCLGAQKWLRACGWRAISTRRRACGEDDAIRFAWVLGDEAEGLLAVPTIGEAS